MACQIFHKSAGDGTYWLKPESRQSSSVLILGDEKIEQENHPNQRQLTAVLTGCRCVVSEMIKAVRSPCDCKTDHALGFIAELSPKGVIYVSTMVRQQLPGTGRVWRNPFCKARFTNIVLPRYNIKCGGEKISLMD